MLLKFSQKMSLFFAVVFFLLSYGSLFSASILKNKNNPLTLAYGFPGADMATGAYNGHTIFTSYRLWKDKYVHHELLSGVMIFLVDIPVYSSVVVFQHEYFGHAYWGRIYGVNSRTVIMPPFPYSYINPDTIDAPSGYVEFKEGFPHMDANILAIAGGMEANTMAARILKEKYFGFRSLAMENFYTWNKLGPFFYIMSASGDSPVGTINQQSVFGDPVGYRNDLSYKYNKKDAIPVNTLRLHSLWILVDPIIITNLPFIGRYMSKKIPNQGAIKTGRNTYLSWSSNYFLTPYGEEFDMDFSFWSKGKYFFIAPRIGNGIEKFFYGLSLKAKRLITLGLTSWGFGLEGWMQPKFNKGKAEKEMQPGGAAALYSEIKVSKKIYFNLEGGYKTAGYLPGRPFTEDVFALGSMTYLVK